MLLKRPLSLLVSAALCAVPSFADNVALLINNEYVDYSLDGGLDSEAMNLENQIPLFGHNVTSFTSVDPTDLANTLVGQDALVIPELESDGGGGGGRGTQLSSDLGATGRTVIHDFVAAGGNLIAFTRGGGNELVNDIFGFSIDAADLNRVGGGPNDTGESFRGGDEYFLTANAVGNTFEDGPPVLISMSGTDPVDIASLPGSALTMYENLAGTASVVDAIPYGEGWVFLFGWDWFQGFLEDERGGDQEQVDDWNDALDRAIRFPGTESVLEVPLSRTALALLAMLLVSGGVLFLRRH